MLRSACAMDEAHLRRLNLALVGVVAALLGLAASASPWGSTGLAAWTALPVLVFVPLVLLAKARIGQQVALGALAVFGVVALAWVGGGRASIDPFSGIVAWVVPVALFVLAVMLTSCAALVAARWAARPGNP
jgi:hypothetical protein